MYVLDTSTMSELSFTKPNPHVLTWLDSTPSHSLAIPVSAVIEFKRGIETVRPRDMAHAESLSAWLDALLRCGIPVLPVDSDVAMTFATMSRTPELMHMWQARGHGRDKLPSQDLMIAATAIVHDAVIVTQNGRDFERIAKHHRLRGVLTFPSPCRSDRPMASEMARTRAGVLPIRCAANLDRDGPASGISASPAAAM